MMCHFLKLYSPQIEMGRVNTSIGAILTTYDRSLTYSSTYPYFYVSLVFAIPYGKPYTPLQILFFPFKYRIWLCFSSILFGTMTVVGIFKTKKLIKYRSFVFGRDNTAPFLNMWTICLGSSMQFVPRFNFARALVMIWILMSLVLRAAYQSKLFYFMQTIPRSPPLYSLDSVYDSNLDLYLWESLFQGFYDNLPYLRKR